PNELREIDPGDRVGGNIPVSRLAPVAAIGEAVGDIRVARRLCLGQARRGCDSPDLACPVAAVVPHPVDVEVVGDRRGVDLEVDRLATVDADVGGEALDAGIAAAADVPLALRVARLRVL